jgi:hypothetical protein
MLNGLIFEKKMTSLDSTHLKYFEKLFFYFSIFIENVPIFLFETDQLTTIIGRLTDLTDQSTSGYRLNYVFYLQPTG